MDNFVFHILISNHISRLKCTGSDVISMRGIYFECCKQEPRGSRKCKHRSQRHVKNFSKEKAFVFLKGKDLTIKIKTCELK